MGLSTGVLLANRDSGGKSMQALDVLKIMLVAPTISSFGLDSRAWCSKCLDLGGMDRNG
jgi:hypothetical protein